MIKCGRALIFKKKYKILNGQARGLKNKKIDLRNFKSCNRGCRHVRTPRPQRLKIKTIISKERE